MEKTQTLKKRKRKKGLKKKYTILFVNNLGNIINKNTFILLKF